MNNKFHFHKNLNSKIIFFDHQNFQFHLLRLLADGGLESFFEAFSISIPSERGSKYVPTPGIYFLLSETSSVNRLFSFFEN